MSLLSGHNKKVYMSNPPFSNSHDLPRPNFICVPYKGINYSVSATEAALVSNPENKYAEIFCWALWIPIQEPNRPAIFFLKHSQDAQPLRWPSKTGLGLAHFDIVNSQGYPGVIRLADYQDKNTPSSLYCNVYIHPNKKYKYNNSFFTKITPLETRKPLNLPDLQVKYPHRVAHSNVLSEVFANTSPPAKELDVLFPVGVLASTDRMCVLLKDGDGNLRGWCSLDALFELQITEFYAAREADNDGTSIIHERRVGQPHFLLKHSKSKISVQTSVAESLKILSKNYISNSALSF